MLLCQSSDLFPSFASEQFYDFTDRSGFHSPVFTTPLPAVKNYCSPLSPGHNFSTISRKHMQHSVADSEDCGHPAPSQVHIKQRENTVDAGLGITTDDNVFIGSYQNLDSEQHLLPACKEEDSNLGPIIEVKHERRLSSPFNDHYYTPASHWGSALPHSSLSEGVPSNFVSTPDQTVLLAPDGPLPSHYTASPISYAGQAADFGTFQQGIFKRPEVRHPAMTSSVPQINIYSYETPSIEASPFQWTPQSDTPGWHDTTPNLNGQMQMPTVMLDYSNHHSVASTPEIPAQQPVRSIMTAPVRIRKKPHLRPSFSESSVQRISTPARLRAASAGYVLHDHLHERCPDSVPMPQLPLPPLPPSVLINTPRLQDQNLAPPSVLINTPHIHEQNIPPPPTPAPNFQRRRSYSHASQHRKRPSSPPPSDFVYRNVPYLVPIRQDPAFDGDLYTPRYKRRMPNGRWEGWCGSCQPGRWLDLKNSRYWEDKLRNHGICAKTKVKFEEPEQVRWVDAEGMVIPDGEIYHESGDPFFELGKREGLCGVCHTWVSMDGMRTKARDRAVGWWTHAYKCHDHDKATKRQAATAPM